jgi:CPA2 family monovalent cation:H+ antiporter-2
MAVFFTAVGLRINLDEVASHLPTVLMGAAAVLVIKTLVIGVSAWSLGLTARSALLTGTYLGNVGEFALVVLAAGVSMGVIPPDQSALVVGVAIVTLIASPILVPLVHRKAGMLDGVPLAPWIRAQALREADDARKGAVRLAHVSTEGHVVIAGFGPVGRAVADHLEIAGVPITVIELNPRTVERQARIGRHHVVYGDITNPQVMETAGIRNARAIVITIPDDDAALRACRAVRAINPGAFVAVRTNFLSGAFQAHQFGADHVTVEEVATAEAMQKAVLDRVRKVVAAEGSTFGRITTRGTEAGEET